METMYIPRGELARHLGKRNVHLTSGGKLNVRGERVGRASVGGPKGIHVRRDVPFLDVSLKLFRENPDLEAYVREAVEASVQAILEERHAGNLAPSPVEDLRRVMEVIREFRAGIAARVKAGAATVAGKLPVVE